MDRERLRAWLVGFGSLAVVLAAGASAQAQLNFGNLFGGNSGGYQQQQRGMGRSQSWDSMRGTRRSHLEEGGSSGEFDWPGLVGGIVEGVSKIPQQPQNTWQPQDTWRQPRNVQPYNPPVYRPQPVYTPPNTVKRPVPKTAAPKNVLVKKLDPPKNDASLGLTGAEEEAAEDTAEEADKLADQAEDQLVNDPKLTDPAQGGKINGDRDVKDAVEKFKETGDSSDLEKIKNDPTTPDSVKDKIGIFIDAKETGDLIRDGGLNPKGTDGLIDNLQDQITKSPNLTPTEKQDLRDQADAVQDSNDNRKVIDAIVNSGGGGSGGLSGGGPEGGGISLDGLDLTSIDPQGPIFVDEAVEDAEGAAVTSGTLLVNPDENGESVSYVLANRQYTMNPGQSQKLDRTYTIEFDRGGEFGNARYSLPGGTYEFTITDRGWELQKKTYEATIDNSRYPGAFGYVLDNKKYTLEAGEQKTHTSAYPLVVIFDRGDGGEPARKELRSGVYQVGLDASEGRLDLFDESEEGSLLSSRNN